MKRSLMLRFVAIIALLTTTPTLANEETESSTPLSPEEALEQYELRRIGFDDYVSLAFMYSPVAIVGRPRQWSAPYEGKYKKPLEGEAFYQKLGRDDLLAEYQSRSTTKLTLKIVGGAVAVGGLTFAIASLASSPDSHCSLGPDFESCWRRRDAAEARTATRYWVGAGVGLVGAGLLMWGVFRNPHPISASEARELADGHNKRLRQELGLTDVPAPAPRKRPNVITARLTPVIGPHTGGLLVDGSF